MKNWKKIVSFLLITLTVFACSGCSSLPRAFENEELRGYTDTFLTALLADDVDGAYGLLSEVCSEQEFSTVFREMRDLVGEADSYELKLLNVAKNRTLTNGSVLQTSSAVYEVSIGGKRYIVNLQASSEYENLSAFHLTPYEKTDYYSTGSLGHLKDSNALQWILLLSNLVAIGFSVFAIADCARHNVKWKPLWILLCLVFFSVGITVSATSFYLNLNPIGLFSYTAWIRYGGGTNVFRLMLPLGSVAYFALRHWLIHKPASVSESATDSPVESEALEASQV